ncbi:MAG: hypothetical protein ABUL63_00670 [Acidobacteriota bacterium]
MDEFNYLAVLISIILGLGITQLLSGFARWIEQRSAFRAFGPSILWTATLLVVHIQTWWSMFGMRNHPDWTFVQFCLVLLQPIVLYLLAALVLPSSTSELDLKANYFGQRRWFFSLLVLLLTVSLLKYLALEGRLPDATNLAFHVALALLSAVGIATENLTVHRLLAYSTPAAIAVYIGLLFARLQ